MPRRGYCPNCGQKLKHGENHAVTESNWGKPVYLCTKKRERTRRVK